MNLAGLKKLRRPQFIRIAGQIYLYIPVVNKEDGSSRLDYIVSYLINKNGLPERDGKVIYCAEGLDMEMISQEVEDNDRMNCGPWKRAYAVCMSTKEKVASPT